MKERIRHAALRLGFSAVGFAGAEPHEDGERVAEWVEGERHGTMTWMAHAPARRGDPAAILPGARTVISVAAGYYPGDWPHFEGPGGDPVGDSPGTTARGRIARYAWGRDYHKKMKRKLVR